MRPRECRGSSVDNNPTRRSEPLQAALRGVFVLYPITTNRKGGLLNTLYTPREVATMLKVSTDTVMRQFSTVAGVIDLGSPESARKRRYRTLRIPAPVLDKFLIERRITK